MELVPTLAKALGRFRRRLVINELLIHVLIAGEDPCDTAINYGRANAAIGALIPLLENTFRIKKRRIAADISFLETKISVYCKATLKIAVWALLAIAFSVLFRFIKIKLSSSQKRKVEKADGKASDFGPDGNNNAENS